LGSFAVNARPETARIREFSRHVFEIAALSRASLKRYNLRVWVQMLATAKRKRPQRRQGCNEAASGVVPGEARHFLINCLPGNCSRRIGCMSSNAGPLRRQGGAVVYFGFVFTLELKCEKRQIRLATSLILRLGPVSTRLYHAASPTIHFAQIRRSDCSREGATRSANRRGPTRSPAGHATQEDQAARNRFAHK
jgi:hypothetical protein